MVARVQTASSARHGPPPAAGRLRAAPRRPHLTPLRSPLRFPPPLSRSLLGALPRLRLLSLTVTAPLPAGYHAHLAACRQLEEVHLYLAPMLPARFELQPGAIMRLIGTGGGRQAGTDSCRHPCRQSSPLSSQVAVSTPVSPSLSFSCPCPAAALMRLTRLRSLLISSTPGTLCGLTVGPGLAGLPALQELQVGTREWQQQLLLLPHALACRQSPGALAWAPTVPQA